MPLTDYLIQPGEMMTPEAADRKRKIAQALMLRGSDTSPVQHWSQGAARLSDALFGALEDVKVDRQESDAKKAASGLESGLFAALAGGGGASAPAPTGGVAGALGGGPFTGGFDQAVNKVLGYEGGYTVDNGGPTNFGISSRANPDVDVRSLTPEKAKALYKTRYWDAIGGDQIAAQNPGLALAAFDTAVNAGPGTAKRLLAQSGGDPQKLIALRQQYNNRLIEQNPSEYGKYAKGWNNRLADLGQTVGYQNMPATPQMAQGDAGYQNMPATPQMAQNGAGYQNAADVAAPGAQPAEYQIPGQQPQQGMGGGQSVAVQQAMRLLNNPYTSPAAKMIAQQVLARAMKGTDPKDALEQRKLGLEIQMLEQKAAGGTPQEQEEAKVRLDVLRKQLAKDERPSDIQAFEYGQQNPAYVDQQIRLREAGRPNSTIVNDLKAEGKFESTLAEGQARMFNGMAEDAVKARTDLSKIQQLRSNISQLPGGLMGGLAGMASDYGIKLGPNASAVEAASALISQLVPTQKAPGSGTISDADLDLFKKSLPKLSNTPQGNALILDTMQAMAEYKQRQGEIAFAVVSGDMSRSDAFKKLRDLPDPMEAFRKGQDKIRDLPTPVDGWQDVGGGFKLRQK